MLLTLGTDVNSLREKEISFICILIKSGKSLIIKVDCFIGLFYISIFNPVDRLVIKNSFDTAIIQLVKDPCFLYIYILLYIFNFVKSIESKNGSYDCDYLKHDSSLAD